MFTRAKFKRFFVIMVVILLIFPNTTAFASSYPIQSAEENVDLENQEPYFIYSDSSETIPLYAEPSDKASDILIEAPNPSKVQLLEDLDSDNSKDEDVEFLLVLFEMETEDEVEEVEGYVNKDFIIDEDEMDKILSNNALETEDVKELAEGEQDASDEDSTEGEESGSELAEDGPDASDEELAEDEQDAPDEKLADDEQDASDEELAEDEQDASDEELADDEQDAPDEELAEDEQDVSDEELTEDEQDASNEELTEDEQDASDEELAKDEQDALDEEPANIQGFSVLASLSNLQGVAIKNKTHVYKSRSTSSKKLKSYNKGTILKYRSYNANWFQATVYANGKWQTGYIHKNDVENVVNNQQSQQGVAKNNPTHVYKSASTNSGTWKTYSAGSLLKYKTFTSNWYQATVYVNGKAQTGYIHKNHVENADSNPSTIQGVAKNNPTRIYKSTSTNSGTWKTYSAGSLLKYRTFTSNWYQATVYVNGKAQTGFIHKNHVENADSNPSTIQGVAKNNPTRIYKSTSTSSGTWKTYSAGSLLKYRTFTSNWYQATVYVNGKAQTGYIHKNHVENADSNPSTIQGVAKNNPTRIYKSTSTSSGTWKTYSAGSLLKYKTFTSNWYQATVYVNGKAQTGFIHKNHVENADSNPSTIQGIAKNNPTRIYKSTSTSSGTWKTYSAGSLLKYKTFTSNWYQATVFVNGKAQTGFIHKNHVENIYSNQKTQTGYAAGNGSSMNVYASPSTSSKVLKTYANNSSIKFKTFSASWYQATVYINGKAKTGYIHKNHVSSKPLEPKITHNNVRYDYTFKLMVDRQMKQTPKSDGAGRIAATRGEVEFFANPNNFSPTDQEYFQFLVLSSPGGFSAAEINRKILNGAGTLSGQGKAFITAAKKYNINEAYLIAHAMHETGNGKSTLAQGIPVDAKGNVTRNSKGQIARTSLTKHTVYNMYGYGAVDADPINGGAKYAFDRGWFTPEKAIIGGAASINSYISRGQDTLYKMRWNPDNPGYPQYATHVRWATGQTKRIYNLYQIVDTYEAVYEVPTFTNTPSSGKVNASALNVRSGPSASTSKVATLANGAQVNIIGADPNGWYQIESGKTKGWVSATYINLIY
ncbi:SH3 domain-containing protein [Oceanobacillus sp. J11TS1]|uniref:SH3 domain-containing protein n=1 Tax=Oceanobacillus sp. J11TS1 TaxID=2807191 RepID=UPI001B28F8DB|nr:SH3 domain-containing protein [Oceanobacillus sp. J11TS1]GIO23403.1 hypothetical protein J11TS1_19840 [Oceanobacillus sp. J11TS1]